MLPSDLPGARENEKRVQSILCNPVPGMDLCNNMLFESGASCVFIFQTGLFDAGSRFRLDLSTLVPVLFFVASSIFPHVYYFAGFAAAVCA